VPSATARPDARALRHELGRALPREPCRLFGAVVGAEQSEAPDRDEQVFAATHPVAVDEGLAHRVVLAALAGGTRDDCGTRPRAGGVIAQEEAHPAQASGVVGGRHEKGFRSGQRLACSVLREGDRGEELGAHMPRAELQIHGPALPVPSSRSTWAQPVEGS
jgi:hypothetical protein